VTICRSGFLDSFCIFFSLLLGDEPCFWTSATVPPQGGIRSVPAILFRKMRTRE
jgi:hypothetical protein